MADAIVTLGVEKLWDLLNKEYELLGGVEEQVIELKSDLNMLMSFLKDADAKKQTSALVRNCLEEIKEITFDAEDIIEAFHLKKESGIMKHTRSLACVMVDRRQTALDITSISKRITKVIQVMQTFGVQPIIIDSGYAQTLQEIQRETRHTFSREYESDHVGLDANVEKLVSELVDKDDVHVVSITGMGGIGKTTLARHVYNHEKVCNHFKGFAWVCVSQQFTRQYVWETILQSLKPEFKGLKMTDEELLEKLSVLLETHIAFIVLDDMWKEEHWEKIKDAFPRKKGCKILLTSRNEGIALHVDKKCVTFKPQCLTDEDSWTLFQSIAFPRNETGENKVDKEMEKMGMEMSKQCRGLPLAVKVLGGLLAAQYTLREWKRVHENIGTNIMGRTSLDEESTSLVYYVLALSFEELPSYLKHCFLHLAQFPEDCAINVEKLSYYWAAEGILKPRFYDGPTIRDVADCSIKELVKRNMITAERDIKTSRFETCQLHDMMRELCLSKAKEEKFLRIVNTQTSSSSTHFKSRRLAVYWSDRFDEDGETQNPKLRSLLFVEGVKFPYLMITNVSFTMLQFLRVLDLTRAGFKGGKLPSNIGKLIHLRYLSLYKASVAYLPYWLRNLKLLLYLNLDVALLIISATNQNVEKPIYVPNIFKEMQELRYLCLPRKVNDKAKLDLANQVKLETLENFQTKNSSVGDLERMKKLTKLSVYVNRGCSMKTLSSHLDSLSHLETLIIDDKRVGVETLSLSRRWLRNLRDHTLYATRDHGRMGDDAEEFVLKCNDLYQLELNINMPKLPEVKDLSSHLTSITLSHCCLEKDPMPILEKLLQLNEVTLGARAFVGKRMVCSKNGFPQLQKLLLSELEEWEEWIVKQDSMPRLHSLIIRRCGKLKMLPDLRVIPSLKELRLSVTESYFKSNLEQHGEDYYKVRDIPIVQISLAKIMYVSNNRQPGETFLKRMYSNICGRRSRAFLIQ